MAIIIIILAIYPLPHFAGGSSLVVTSHAANRREASHRTNCKEIGKAETV